MKKQDLLYLLLSFLIPFYIYCYTLCPTVSVYADAGEFPTFAFISGFAHPPGYPLFTLILKLFLKIPFGNPALKANLAAAFIAAIALPFFYLLAKKIIRHPFAALITTLSLAFSRVYWRSALTAEVFSLLAFFIITTFLSYLVWIEKRKKRYLYLFIIICGFGLAHHQMLLATLVPLFFGHLFTKNRPQIDLKDCLATIPLGLMGFLPYQYIYSLTQNHWPLMNWENPQNLQGLLRLITRASYGTFILTGSGQKVNFINQMIGIGKIYWQNFQLPGILLILIGSISAFRLNRRLFLYILAVFLLVSVLFSCYSGMPLDQPVQIAYLERFQIIPIIFLALFIGFALTAKQGFLGKKFSVFLIIIPLIIFFLNFPVVNQRNNYFGERLAKDLLWQIPPKSIFVIEADPVINVLFYHRYVLSQNKEITFVIGNLLLGKSKWYQEELTTFYPDLKFPSQKQSPSQYLADFLAINSPGREIYLYTPSLENNLRLSLPKEVHGIVWRYLSSDSQPSSLPEIQNSLIRATGSLENMKFRQKFIRNSSESLLYRIYADLYVYLAEMNHNNLKLSEYYYQQALSLTPDYFLPWLELGEDYEMFDQKEMALKSWKEANKLLPSGKIKDSLQEKIKEYQNK